MASPPIAPRHQPLTARRLLSRRLFGLLVASLIAGVACDGPDELRELDRGTDGRPAIKATPPEEGQ